VRTRHPQMSTLFPYTTLFRSEELNVDNVDQKELICYSQHVLGNGAINDIYDIVYVDIQKFDRSKSRVAAEEVSRLNSKLLSLQRSEEHTSELQSRENLVCRLL